MSTTKPSSTFHIEATADVDAAPADVYRMIADYRSGHPRMVPPQFFRNLCVVEGGYGEGTVITFDVVAMGRTTSSRARVSEPMPGRVLVESDLDKGVSTTFTVDPRDDATSRVTIGTDYPFRGGLIGRIERAIVRAFLRRVYVAELARLNEQLVSDSRAKVA